MSLRPLVLLPTYNETGTLPALLDLLAACGTDVLVIDDASPDGTGDLVESLRPGRPWLALIRRPGKLGLGSAYREGMGMALAQGRPAVLEMDADFSHDPRDVPRLLDAVLGSGAALAIGTRTLPGGGTPGWPLGRRLVSRIGNRYARALLGIPASDLTSGFRAYAGEALRAADPLHARSEGYAFQIEMAWRVWRTGGRIAEVPVVFTDRRLGHSKLSADVVMEAAWRVPALALERLIRQGA